MHSVFMLFVCVCFLGRFVKFQGKTESAYNLNSEDFILVIACDAKLVGARQFCGHGKAACLDSTHEMNKYMTFN